MVTEGKAELLVPEDNEQWTVTNQGRDAEEAGVVSQEGFEPSTHALKGRCSTY